MSICSWMRVLKFSRHVKAVPLPSVRLIICIAVEMHKGYEPKAKVQRGTLLSLDGSSVDTMMIMEVTVHFCSIDTTLVAFEVMIV
jgi:hypothetical protein